MCSARWLMLAVAVTDFVAACNFDKDLGDEAVIIDTDGDLIPDDIDPETPPAFTWRATLVATDAATTDITATSLVRALVNTDVFAAQVIVRNDVTGALRPWHVHRGTCATGGTIVGANAEYPRLRVDNEGAARSSVRLFFRLDPALPYHVDIHESDAAFTTIIACGDLVLE